MVWWLVSWKNQWIQWESLYNTEETCSSSKSKRELLRNQDSCPYATFLSDWDLKARSSRPELFLGVLKICSKFIGEHPCRSETSIKLKSKFIEIKLQRGCSPVKKLHIFRTFFTKNTYKWLLLNALLMFCRVYIIFFDF